MKNQNIKLILLFFFLSSLLASCGANTTTNNTPTKKAISGTVSYNGLIDNKYESGTNVAITPLTLDTISGDYVASIAPDLPTGFSFDSSSGTISGTPTSASSNEYTVTATGTGDYIGSISGSIIIVIKEKKAITGSMSYNGVIDNKYEEYTNIAMSLSLNRTITGDYDLSIAPPLTGTGLSFNPSSGTISGTPTSASSNEYTVTATGTGDYIGSISASIIIVIKEKTLITGTMSYTQNKYEEYTNIAMSLSLNRTITGTYDLSITPSLTGTGLSFNPSSGTISGMPTSGSSNQYTVTLTGTGDYIGSISGSIIIVIKEKEAISGTVSYNGLIDNKYESGTNVAITPLTLDTISGDYVASIAPDLPAGFSFDSSSGTISGTPTTASSNEYTVTATGTGDYIGSISGSIIIVVKEKKAITGSMSYNGVIDNKYEEYTNIAMSLSLNSTITGDYDLSIAPPLTGTGLSFNPSSGTISGTPTSASSNEYTVTATGTGDYIGSISGSIIIVIKEKTPITGTMSYTQNKYEEYTNIAVSLSLNRTITGTYDLSITPSLTGTGLSFNPSSGTISGMPTSGSSNQYTVTATGTGDYIGSISGSIIIAIKEKEAITGTVSYIGAVDNKYESVTNVAITPLTLDTISGDYVASIAPDLPTGFSFDSSSGTISGTPTTTSSNQYTVTLTGMGDYIGSISGSIIIAIFDGYTPFSIVEKAGIPVELMISNHEPSTALVGETNWSSSDTSIATVSRGVVMFAASSSPVSVMITATIGEDRTNKEVSVESATVNDLGVITTKGSHKNLVIFESTANIGEKAFDGNQLTSVRIPDSVMNIGVYAFRSNQLTSVRIPDSVQTIDGGAFQESQLRSVTIGNSVQTIGNYSFSQNQLRNVIIGNSVRAIGFRAFSQNQLRNVIIGNSVQTIDDGAFNINQLSSISIPDSVMNIGNYAFYSNQLTSIIIPDSMTNIGNEAFHQNQLRNVTIGNSVQNIGIYAFRDNQLNSVSIPDSVQTIGNGAFTLNPSLTNVTLSVTLYNNLGASGRKFRFGTQVSNWYKPDGTRQ